MWWTSTHIKGNLGHREGHDLAHQCQRGEITADNPQGYWQGCSSSSLWSLAAAAKKSGHKDGRSKAKEGLLPNMGPEQSEKLYTPPRAQRCSPTICRPAASPKREVSPRSGEGELGTPPPRPPAVPIQQPVSVACPALRGTLLTPQGFAVLGHALKSEASTWSKPPTWCLHASPRASFGGHWKRVKTSWGWWDTSEKIVQSFWWALLGEDSCSQGLQPHRCSVGQTQSEIPPEWSQ